MQVVLIPGDGIGPEVTRAAQEVVAAAGVALDWVIAPAGLATPPSNSAIRCPKPRST